MHTIDATTGNRSVIDTHWRSGAGVGAAVGTAVGTGVGVGLTPLMAFTAAQFIATLGGFVVSGSLIGAIVGAVIGFAVPASFPTKYESKPGQG
jgi:hypothetical protein